VFRCSHFKCQKLFLYEDCVYLQNDNVFIASQLEYILKLAAKKIYLV